MPKWVADEKARKKKQEEQKTGSKGKSQSPSVNKVNNISKRSTFLGGGSSVRRTEETVKRPSAKARRLASTAPARSNTPQRLTDTGTRGQASRTSRMTDAQYQKTYGQPRRTAETIRREQESEERRRAAQRQKSGLNDQPTSAQKAATDRALKNTLPIAKESAKGAAYGHLTTLNDIASIKSQGNGKSREEIYDPNLAEKSRQQAEKRVKKYQAKTQETEDAIQKLTKNAKGLEKAYYGAVESGTGMLTDMALGMGTQGGSLAAMFSRTYGSTRGKAQQEGATEAEDRAYAAAQAAKEVGTELMFPGAGLARGYAGKQGLKLADTAANILTKNLRGRAADIGGAGVRLLGGVLEENAEELAGWGLDPLIKEITYGKNTRTRNAQQAMKERSNALRAEIQNEDDARAAAAYLSSDDFFEQTVNAYREAGLSKKDAEEVAERMRDYLTASLTGDTDSMEQIEDEVSKKVAGSKKLEWDFDELKDTIASTTLLTAATGLPGTGMTAVKGAALRDQLGDDGVRALASTAIDFEDSEMSLKAKAMKARLDSGNELTSTQVYDLQVGMQEQIRKDTQREESSRRMADKRIKSDNLLTPYRQNENGGIDLDEATEASYREHVSKANEIIDGLTSETKESLTANEKVDGSKAIAGFQTGVFTIEDANTLNYSNTTVRAAFEEATGVDLGQYVVKNKDGSVNIPATNTKTKDALFAMAADNLVKSAQAETANWMDNTKGQVVTQVSARMGAQGSAVLQQALDDVDERDRSKYMMTTNAADMMYQAARNMGAEWSDIAAEATRMFPGIDPKKLEKMYIAGLEDRIIANSDAHGRQVRMGQALSEMGEQETATGKVFIDTEVPLKGSVIRTFTEIAKNLGADIHFVDYIYDNNNDPIKGANGSYDPNTNTFYLNVTTGAETNIGYIFMHETTHYLKTYAPEQYQALENLVRERWFAFNPSQMQDTIARKIEAYKRATKGQQVLTEEQALEEIIADASHDFINDPEFAKQVAEENMGLAKAILDSIRNALRMLRRIFASGSIDDDTHMNSLFRELDILKEAEKLWLDAYKASVRNSSIAAMNAWQDEANEQSRMSVAEDKWNNDEKLTKAKFNSFYSAHKLTYGRATKENIDDVVAKIKTDGFISTTAIANVVPASINDYVDPEKPNLTQSKYGAKEGDVVMLVPNKYVDLKNDIIKNGYKPRDYEIVTVERDYQPYYELYSKAYDDAHQTRFSVSEPVERVKDLIAVHNLNEEDLVGNLGLGGFPMPSIAITKDSMSHEKYGDISLLFNSDTIDPTVTNANQVFGGDAYTPTFPTVHYKANSKVSKKLVDMYYNNSNTLGYDAMRPMYEYAVTIDDTLDRVGGEAKLVEKAKKDTALMRLYLRMNDKDVETITTSTTTSLSDAEVERNDFWINELGKDAILEARPFDLKGREAMQHFANWRDERFDDLKKAYEKLCREVYGFDDAEIKEVMADEKTVKKEISSNIVAASHYLKNGRDTTKTEIDYAATNKLVEETAKANGYDAWVDDLFKGIEEKSGIRNDKDWYTPAGNRRSWESLHEPVTLDNVVRQMKKELDSGGGTFLGNNPVGAAQKKYKSLDDIRADEDRLQYLDDENYGKLREQATAKLSKVAHEIYENSPKRMNSYAMFGAIDVGSDVAEALNKTRNKDKLKKILERDYSYNVSEQNMDDLMDALHDLANLPTGYFEAKPKRAVRFDEVKAAIVPKGFADHLKAQLSTYGTSIYEYNPEIEGDRTEKVNQAASENDLRFSISEKYDDAYMEAVNSGNMDEAQRLVDEAAKAAGYTERVYHGTGSNFTVFDINRAGNNHGGYSMFGKGFYFSDSEAVANIWGKDRKMMHTFIRLENPYIASDDITEGALFDAFTELRNKWGFPKKDTLDGILAFETLNEQYGYDYTTELLKENGYDGVIYTHPESKTKAKKEGSKAGTKEYIVFDAENIKSADTITYDIGYKDDGKRTKRIIPLSERFDPTNNDIRYSLPTQDSDGNILTDGQMEYFKNSQARDEQGRLVPVYHTTNKGGFTVFDPMRSDDHRSLFFAEDWDTSQTYGNYANSRFYYFDIDNIDDVKKYLDAYSPDRYFVTQEQFDQAGGWEADMLDFENVTNGEQSDFAKYLDNPDGYIAIIGVPDYSPDNTSYADTWVMAKSSDELVRELHNHFGWQRDNYRIGTQHGYYACYLNLEDPYIIDAHGDNWNEIHLDDYDDDVTFNTREIAEMAMDMDFDGVIIRNLVDQGGASPYDGMFDYSDIYIAFSSNQVKDINNENPTENPDIRYSIVDDDEAMSHAAHDYAYDNSEEALAYYESIIGTDTSEETTYERAKKYIAKDVDEFYAGLTHYADGMKFDDPVLEQGRVRMARSKQDYFNSNIAKWNESWLTEGEVLDPKSVKKPVRDLVTAVMQESDTARKYKTELVNKAIIDMRLAYFYAKQGRTDVADALLWHSAHRMIDGVEFYADDSTYEDYKGLRDYLKTTRIQLGEEYWSDADYGAFRKANFGRINLVKGSTNVDQIYAELEEMFPGLFDSEEYTTPPDQLMDIAAVLDSIQPYKEAYSSEQAAEFATDIASDLLDIMQNGKELQSMADKYKNRYEAKVKAMKARHAEAMLKVRQEKEKGIKAEKAKFKEYVEKQREKKYHTKYFNSIQTSYKKLTERLLSNTADKNIPEQYKKELAKVLAAFDLQTVGSKKWEARNGRKSQKSIKMASLKVTLGNIENQSGEFHVSDAITDIIDELLGKNVGNGSNRSIEGLTLDELNSSELARIDKLLKALVHEFNTYKTVKINTKRQQVQDIGKAQVESALEHAKVFGAGQDYYGFHGWVDRILNMDELTPAYLFRRIDPNKEGMALMYEQLEDSHDKYIRNTVQLSKWIDEIVGEYHHKGLLRKDAGVLEEWRSENYAEVFKLENGHTIVLTPAQIMSVYCLSKRAQAYNHMTGAGIVVAPVSYNAKILSDLKKKAKVALPEMLTDADIKNIVSKLNPDQIKVADKLQNLMADKMAAWGNEASMNVLGIELFGEPDYFPIKSDKAGLISDLSEDQFVEAIRSFGFTKAVQPGARNAIMVEDIFDVITQHCNNMNLYNAYSEAINDFMKVYNYRNVSEEGEYTVKQAIGHAYSQKATNFIMSFMKDLNGNVSNGRTTGINDAFNDSLAKAKKASVFANIRVAAQQPTAIGRAFAVISPKYASAMLKPDRAILDEMFEHCPIAKWKSLGYYDINMGRNIEDVIMNNNNVLEEAATWAYGALDNITWGGIWQMVKAETEDIHSDIEKGSDEYWDLCNRRMREVVAFTQVVDSPFHRSHAMRSKNFMDKLATAFGAEPTLTYNMVRDGYIRAKEMVLTGDKAGATKVFGRTMSVFVFTAGLTAAAAAFADVLRGKHPDGDDDDELTLLQLWWANTLANWKDNVNLLNNIYYVKDIMSLLDGWQINNLAFQGWKYIGTGLQQLYGSPYARSKDPWWKNMMYGVGYLSGMPIKTVMTDFGAIFNKAKEKLGFETPILDAYLESLDELSFQKDDAKASSQASMWSVIKENTVDKAAEKMGYKPVKQNTEEGATERESFLARIGLGKTEEEKQQEEFDNKAKDIAEKTADLEGEAKDKKVWSYVTTYLKSQNGDKPISEFIQAGDYSTIDKYREMYVAAGGNTDYFDQRIFDTSKSAMKKTIVYDPTDEQIAAQDNIKSYLLTHGMDESELSEMVYKSDTAKDMKVAFRLNDKELMLETLTPLVRAGLSYEDLERLWDNRNRMQLSSYKGRYKDKLKSTGKFIWPTDGQITSYFGYRNAPTRGASSNHPAIDIGAPMGADVVAADGGVVIYAGTNGGYGNSVGIKHDNGMVTYYNHLSAWNVNVGDTVAQGQQIANVGSTGISTGPHLDFKVLNADGEPVDPLKYLASRS